MVSEKDISDALCHAGCARISVWREGDVFVADTPHVLQDGSLVRVFLEERAERGFRVSDGGLTLGTIEESARTPAGVRARIHDLVRIATALDISFDGEELHFFADSLENAASRCSALAQAVDRLLSTMTAPSRLATNIRERLAVSFERKGLTVETNRTLGFESEYPGVRVDFVVRSGRHEAAVEVVGGRTRQGVAVSLDRALVNLHQLNRAAYQGRLFGVYDGASVARDARFLARFEAAKPRDAELLSDSDAPARIASALTAA